MPTLALAVSAGSLTRAKLRALHRIPTRHYAECGSRVAVEVKLTGVATYFPKNAYAELSVVVMKSTRRSKGRSQWRFIVGLSVVGLLIIASASHAAQPFFQ